jgi:hypothetical protein
MTSNLMERIAGSSAWIRATFPPRVQLKMRDEARRLERTTEARAVVVWLPDAGGGERLAFTGDFRAIPARFPSLDETVPSFEEFALDNGERVHAVVQIVQLGRGLPSLRVAAIETKAGSSYLFDAIDDCAVRLERIAVEALTARRST